MLNNNVFAAFLGVAVLVAPAFAGVEQMELSVGERKSITLPGNPTTGYLWRVADAPQTVQVDVTLEDSKAPLGMVGCPRASIVTVTAKKVGQGVIKLVYARPWEKDKAPLETLYINVNVK